MYDFVVYPRNGDLTEEPHRGGAPPHLISVITPNFGDLEHPPLLGSTRTHIRSCKLRIRVSVMGPVSTTGGLRWAELGS